MSAKNGRWARYLRKVHVEWTPFKPKACAPIVLAQMQTSKIMAASPKLEVTKKLLQNPTFIDRTTITFANGATHTIELDNKAMGDVIEEIDIINGSIVQEEAKRGKPFT